MTVFKIWDATRQLKKLVVAATMSEIMDKASEKLGFAVTKIVLEDDGTEVDGDEELLAFAGSTLVALRDGEVWAPASATPSPATTTTDQTVTLAPVNMEQPVTINTSAGPAPVPTPAASCSSGLVRSVSLPSLSGRILSHLRDGDVSSVWREIVNESAHYYLITYPNLSDKAEYRAIGEKMWRTFPSIGHDGPEKWSHFTTCLSQRIRHLRWDRNRKSRSADGSGSSTASASKKPRFCRSQDELDKEISEEDYESHVAELTKEWSKNKRNTDHINVLLRDTFVNRRAWICQLPAGEFSQIVEKFPCFEDGQFLLTEFLFVIKKTTCVELLAKLKSILSNCETLMDTKPQGSETERVVAVLKWLEEKTGYKRGKGVKTKSILEVKKDIAANDVDEQAASEQFSAPHLVLFVSSTGDLEEAVVAADTKKVFTRASDVYDAIIALVASYYVADFTFPKIYCNILSIFQQFLVGEAYSGERAANCIIFLKKHSHLL